MRQLAFVLGDAPFRRGLQVYLEQHKYGNATWSDLIGAFQTASGRDLTAWAEMWIRHRGMPLVTTQWSCADGRLRALRLSQGPAIAYGLDQPDEWPIATEVALGYPDGSVKTVRAELDTASAAVPLGAGGEACPAWVFANNDDHAYGLFLLDAQSRAAVMQQVATMPDLFRRTLLWGSLWDSVRQAELDPVAYVNLALDALPRNAMNCGGLAAGAHPDGDSSLCERSGTAGMLARGEALAADRMMQDPDHDLRIVWFRSLAGLGAQAQGGSVMKELLRKQRTIPGVELRQQDRWSLVTALLAYGDPEADAVFAAEQKADATGDGRKFAYVAEAVVPTQRRRCGISTTI